MSREIIEEWVRAVLPEITAYSRRRGPGRSPAEVDVKEVESHVDDLSRGRPQYAFTMVSIPKIGLNPRSPYDTPAGVCFYPLNRGHFNDLLKRKLPFQSDAPYVGFVKLNWDTARWLEFGTGRDASKEEHSRALEYVRAAGGQNAVEKALWDGRHRHEAGNYSGLIYDLLWAHASIGKSHGKSMKSLLSRGFRDLGYDGLYDNGTGTLHQNEPWQAIALNKRAWSQDEPWLRIYQGSKFQKAVGGPPTAEEIDYKIEGRKEAIQLMKKYAAAGEVVPPEVCYMLELYLRSLPEGIHLYSLRVTKHDRIVRLPDNLWIETELTIMKDGLKIPKNLVARRLSVENVNDVTIPSTVECEGITIKNCGKTVKMGDGLSVNNLKIISGGDVTIPKHLKVDRLEIYRTKTPVVVPSTIEVNKIYWSGGAKPVIPDNLRTKVVVI